MEAMLRCRICMNFELWFYSYFWDDFEIDCKMVLCHVFGMFCVVFVTCVMASIGRIMWLMDKGCSGMVLGQNWRVPELPRSSLARWCVEATLLRGWAQNCSPRVRNPCTPPNSDDHNFFVRTLFWVFLDSMESPLSQDSNHIPLEDSILT